MTHTHTLPVPEATSIDRLTAEVERLEHKLAVTAADRDNLRTNSTEYLREIRSALSASQAEVARLTALNEELQGLLTTQGDSVARLARQTAAAVAALEPFARWADKLDECYLDHDDEVIAGGVGEATFTFGEARLARATLAQIREASDAG